MGGRKSILYSVCEGDGTSSYYVSNFQLKSLGGLKSFYIKLVGLLFAMSPTYILFLIMPRLSLTA